MTLPPEVPHEIGLLLTLREVRDGRIRLHEPDAVSDLEQSVPKVLGPFLRELFAHGQVQLGLQLGGEPLAVVMTTAGEELLAELEKGTEP